MLPFKGEKNKCRMPKATGMNSEEQYVFEW